jgi:hypothetical protein
MSLQQLIDNAHLRFDPAICRSYIRLKQELSQDEQITTDEIAKRLASRDVRRANRLSAVGRIVPQSDMKGEMVHAGDESEKIETVQDVMGEAPHMVTAGSHAPHIDDGMNETFLLQKFLQRPATIYDTTWPTGSHTNVVLDVWDLWSSNPTVRNKLTNYAYFKGDLKLKIAFSGTPFHYGKVLISYQPYAYLNYNLELYDTYLAYPFTLRNKYLNYLSQAHQTVVVDIKENEPVELTIPFISPKTAFRLFNDSAAIITNATSFTDFLVAGQLRMSTINVPRVANTDAATAISVNVYAWCPNSTLSVPTATNMNIDAQSERTSRPKNRKRKPKSNNSNGRNSDSYQRGYRDGVSDAESDDDEFDFDSYEPSNLGGRMMKGAGQALTKAATRGPDEYTDPGPLTKVATAVSGFAANLSEVPVIGKFAKATSTVSAGLSKVFNLFGWSKPVQLAPPIFVSNQPWARSAVSGGHSMVEKLALDNKNEVSVDPSIAGATDLHDELAITTLASKESFFTTFQWSSANVAMDTLLFTGAVTPYYSDSSLHNGFVIAQYTAMAYAALPFKFWRGTITYRFEIVASRFHRGKLLIAFEPNIAQFLTITSTTTKLNQQNTLIVDIQETQDVEFDVEWCTEKLWLENNFNVDIRSVAATPSAVGITLTQVLADFNNENSLGLVYVQPFNELVQPSSSAPVEVNVYVHCKNLEVAAPDTARLSEFNPRQKVVPQSETTTKVLVTGTKNADEAALMCFGEKVGSFRALLKRWTHWFSFTSAIPGSDTRVFTCTYTPLSMNTIRKQPECFIAYLTPAFLGIKGSIRLRHRGVFRSLRIPPSSTTTLDWPVSWRRGNYSNIRPSASFNVTSAAPTPSPVRAGISGLAPYLLRNNASWEVEFPYYSPNFFVFGFNEGYGLDAYASLPDNNYMMPGLTECECHWPMEGECLNMIDFQAGEDYTLMHFNGAPLFSVGP